MVTGRPNKITPFTHRTFPRIQMLNPLLHSFNPPLFCPFHFFRDKIALIHRLTSVFSSQQQRKSPTEKATVHLKNTKCFCNTYIPWRRLFKRKTASRKMRNRCRKLQWLFGNDWLFQLRKGQFGKRKTPAGFGLFLAFLSLWKLWEAFLFSLTDNSSDRLPSDSILNNRQVE